MRLMRLLAALVLAPLILAASHPSVRADAPAGPQISTSSDTIRAADGTSWSVPFSIQNPLASGFYTDSVRLTIVSLDPGETHAPREQTVRLEALARLMEPVDAGGLKTYECTVPATGERARLTLHVDGHAGDRAYSLALNVLADGGPLTDAYPSRLVTVGGRAIELVPVAAAGEGPHPGVLLVHGQGSHARSQLHMADLLARRGWNVMLVSQPGYGQSQGPADMMGPATVRALAVALDSLEALPGTDRRHLAAWGVSRGATAALLLAAQRPEIGSVVAQSASYDLWATYRHAPAEFGRGVVAEAGRDSAGWKARSPLVVATKLGATVLILHGAKDEIAPVEAARAMDRALTANGGHVERIEAPNSGHRLNPRDGSRPALEFLTRRFASE